MVEPLTEAGRAALEAIGQAGAPPDRVVELGLDRPRLDELVRDGYPQHPTT